MSGTIDARLADLGITLTSGPAPQANYVPYVIAGDLVFVSGQIPLDADGPVTGIVGQDVDLDHAQAAARLCGLALLAQLRAACGGDLDRVKQVVKLTGFVNAVPGYAQQPQVVNACSDLMVDVFGDAGRHARAAVGAGSLPLNVSVEIEGVFQIA